MSPAVLHCEMQAIMNPTKPCSNATERTDSRLSVCNTNNVQSATMELTLHMRAKFGIKTNNWCAYAAMTTCREITSEAQLYQTVEWRKSNQSTVDTHCVHISDVEQQTRTKLCNVSQNLHTITLTRHWTQSKPRPRLHCVKRPSFPPPERGTAAPSFQPMYIAAKRPPISATAELLFIYQYQQAVVA